MADVPQRVDDDQGADEGGNNGHEHRQGVGDDDEVEAQGHGLAEGKLTSFESEGYEQQGEGGGGQGEEHRPERSGFCRDEAGQGDGQ